MFYLMMHSIHFNYSYMALRKKETKYYLITFVTGHKETNYCGFEAKINIRSNMKYVNMSIQTDGKSSIMKHYLE